MQDDTHNVCIARYIQEPSVFLNYWGEWDMTVFKGAAAKLKAILSREGFGQVLPRNLLKDMNQAAVVTIPDRNVPNTIITTNDKPTVLLGDQHDGSKYQLIEFTSQIPEKDETLKDRTDGFGCIGCGARWCEDAIKAVGVE